MKIKTIPLLIVLLALLSGCTDEDVDRTNSTNVSKQQIYFEVAHTNSSWGKSQRTGFIVDNSGGVRSYQNPISWNDASNELSVMSLSQIKENINNTTATSIKVTSTELSAYVGKIAEITTSDFTKEVAVGNDMGETNFFAYHYDATNDTYHPILLSKKGDFEKHNTNKNAQEIVIWLEKIKAELP